MQQRVRSASEGRVVPSEQAQRGRYVKGEGATVGMRERGWERLRERRSDRVVFVCFVHVC